MKKIEREPVPDEKGDLYLPDMFCVVKIKDLDKQEVYIEQIEREKALSDDNLKAYVKMANDRQLRICNLEREKEETVNI